MTPPSKVTRASLAVALAAILFAWGAAPRADEGMWTAHDLANCPVDSWKARGLELDAAGLHSLTDAVVKLGGGTGSFVSGDGLIVTNHHVAYRAIQRSSDADNDILADGFFAASRDDEIPAPGFEARVLLDVRDVTDEVLAGVRDDMGGAERYDEITGAEARIVNAAEEGRDVDCDVRAFYGGRDYKLYTYLLIKDLRLVYAPPQSIGVYGGEIDNWMWPRHTGDFAFVRAYVAPDGKTAEYSPDNVPFRPKRHLRVSAAPIAEGDFAMVIGYPGSTRRYRSSHSIDFFVNHYYPRRIEYFGEVMAILDSEMERGRDVEIKLTGIRRGLANAYKNYHGMLEGLRRADLLGHKLEEERALMEYASAHPDEGLDATVIDRIGEQYNDYLTFWEQRALLSSMQYASPTTRAAIDIYRWALEREKDDIDREKGYKDRDERSLRRRLQNLGDNLDVAADRRVFAYFIGELAQAGFAPLSGGVDGVPAHPSPQEIDGFAARLFDGTRLTDTEARMEMFGKSVDELRALDDPFIEFAAAIDDARQALEDRYDAFSGALLDLRPRLMALRTASQGRAMYPDANSTMRISVGEVKGYSPRDAVTYGFQSTLSGVVEKHTGEDPFDAPQALLDMENNGDVGPWADPAAGDVPVCFLTTNDITGGNSGSPVLNGRGELIGLAFDGNYESISADYQFIPALTRTIAVDSRYVLFVLDRFSGARALIEELDVAGLESRSGADGAGRGAGH